MWLGIDTSTKNALLALYDEGVIIERIFEPRATQRVIFSEVASILKPDAINELDGIAVGIGPGSFTGVKIGVIAAKTLAWSRSIPLVGIGSMDIVAAGIEVPPDRSVKVAVAVPSTRGESYLAIFHNENNAWTLDGSIRDVKLDTHILLNTLPKSHFILSGEIADQVLSLIDGKLDYTLADEKLRYPSASGIFKLAKPRFESGTPDDPLLLTPHYVRLSQPERIERGQ